MSNFGPQLKKRTWNIRVHFHVSGSEFDFLMETDFGICKPRFHRESFLLVESSMLLTGFFYKYIYVRSIGAVGPWLSLPTSYSYSDPWLRQHGLPSVSKTKPYMVFLKSRFQKQNTHQIILCWFLETCIESWDTGVTKDSFTTGVESQNHIWRRFFLVTKNRHSLRWSKS